MKIIENNIIPFKGFKAINIFGVLFVRKGVKIDRVTLIHEQIHSAQMDEMLYVFFYLWYCVEFIYRLIRLRNWHKAYRAVSFEREAYMYEGFDNYIRQRKPYNWGKFL
jgi:hypothetical protein